jgi:cAMP phosphodiesterase
MYKCQIINVPDQQMRRIPVIVTKSKYDYNFSFKKRVYLFSRTHLDLVNGFVFNSPSTAYETKSPTVLNP